MLLIAAVIGAGVHTGLHAAQIWLEATVTDWIAGTGNRTDPLRSRTDIGSIGENEVLRFSAMVDVRPELGAIDVDGLTSYLFAILQGMAVQAGSGATRADLERVVTTSLAMWPSA